jgi:hypothetical protein
MELHRQVKRLRTHCEELQSGEVDASTFKKMIYENQKAVTRLVEESSKHGYFEDTLLFSTLPKAAMSEMYYSVMIYCHYTIGYLGLYQWKKGQIPHRMLQDVISLHEVIEAKLYLHMHKRTVSTKRMVKEMWGIDMKMKWMDIYVILEMDGEVQERQKKIITVGREMMARRRRDKEETMEVAIKRTEGSEIIELEVRRKEQKREMVQEMAEGREMKTMEMEGKSRNIIEMLMERRRKRKIIEMLMKVMKRGKRKITEMEMKIMMMEREKEMERKIMDVLVEMMKKRRKRKIKMEIEMEMKMMEMEIEMEMEEMEIEMDMEIEEMAVEIEMEMEEMELLMKRRGEEESWMEMVNTAVARVSTSPLQSEENQESNSMPDFTMEYLMVAWEQMKTLYLLPLTFFNKNTLSQPDRVRLERLQNALEDNHTKLCRLQSHLDFPSSV